MNKRIIMLMAAALALLSASGQVAFTGWGKYKPIEITLSENHTSLNKVFVLYKTDGVGMTYTATTNAKVEWYSFDEQGAAYRQKINGITYAGPVSTLPQVKDKGYIIYEGDTPHYYWVVNYDDYYLELNDLFAFGEDTPRDPVSFRVDGNCDDIPYVEINGNPRKLDREMELSYYTLEWKESVPKWDRVTAYTTIKEVPQPLCNTIFTLTGDRFLKEWNLEAPVVETHGEYETRAVSCRSTAYQENSDTGGETGGETDGETGDDDSQDGLGGSAPVHIVFTGYPTDSSVGGAVVFRVWEIATDPDFEQVLYQFYQDVLDYTFYDPGTFYVRYKVDNGFGTCEYCDETVYQVTISESEIDDVKMIPNVFAPGGGSDNYWKVNCKSIVEFHCWIFNRWGNLVYEYTDPNGHWDGTSNGKLVDTGVYFYVLTATGSDGVKYQRRGDITIIRPTQGAGTTTFDGGE